MNLTPHVRMQLTIFCILGSAALASCGLFAKKDHEDSRNSPSDKPTTGQTSDEKKDGSATPPDGMFTCGSTTCTVGSEFCVMERFTAEGKAVANTCHALEASCRNAECAQASLGAPLKDLRCGSFTDSTNLDRIEIILHFIDPDVLPLANKIADKIGGLKVKITSSALLNKIGEGKLFYVEGGEIKNDPSGNLHCNLLNAGSFMTLDAPYAIDKAKFRERIISGSRDAIIYFENTTIGFECIRNQDTTPFVVDDLKTIFGGLAEIIVE